MGTQMNVPNKSNAKILKLTIFSEREAVHLIVLLVFIVKRYKHYLLKIPSTLCPARHLLETCSCHSEFCKHTRYNGNVKHTF